ncbi:response regulator transcription factor [Paucisalibacillus sp. EB02]|uniref:response regulator transcription factor n=1 Tax=Paucisalibacillus sp. EB02 TaxID=1347087 RepID=UPI0004B24D6C|nr:response regulator transcription factor [Paucisalibacillus sp. EB02]
MCEITLIKEKDLVRDIIVEKLEENLPENTWKAFDTAEFNALKNTITSDLVIIDLNTKIDIIATIEDLLEKNVRVAVWTTDIDSPLLRDLFRYGLNGYFYNGMELSELVFATKMMLNDQQYIHTKLSTVLLHDYVKLTRKEPNRPAGILTEQEWNVLEELGRGLNNGSIAKELYISTRTVNNHVSSILKKLHVSDRTNAVIKAIKNNWITL